MAFSSEDTTQSSITDEEGKNFKVLVPAYNGTANTDSYVLLGKWNAAESDALGDGDTVTTATTSPLETTKAGVDRFKVPDKVLSNDVAAGITQADGDDLLWAFVHNTFKNDSRDLYVEADDSDGRANTKRPTSAYQPIAKPPQAAASQASATVVSDQAERAAITREIPEYTGWRDHTEGHRVTTTRGDKVEVIGGNYKLIVLGRGHGTATTDWSGGHVVDTLEAAGNVTSINWRKIPIASKEDGWQWVEETVKGNVVERFHGTHREEFYGDKRVSIIGHSGTVTPTGDADPPGDWDEVDPWSEQQHTWDTLQNETFTLERPVIIEKIRAKSTFEYAVNDSVNVDIDGSKKGTYVFRGCKPKAYTGYTAAGVETTSRDAAAYYKPDISVSGTDFWGSLDTTDATLQTAKVTSAIHATAVHDLIDSAQWTEGVQAGGYHADYVPINGGDGLMKAIEYWRANHIESFMGAHTQLFAAAYTTLGVALRTEAFVGAEWQINFGALIEASAARHVNIAAVRNTCTITRGAVGMIDKNYSLVNVWNAMLRYEISVVTAENGALTLRS